MIDEAIFRGGARLWKLGEPVGWAARWAQPAATRNAAVADDAWIAPICQCARRIHCTASMPVPSTTLQLRFTAKKYLTGTL